MNMYRVSQKTLWNGHTSLKNGSRNKINGSFKYLRNLSCWWALKSFNSNHWGKIGLEVSNLLSKNTTKSILPQTKITSQRCPIVDIVNLRFGFFASEPRPLRGSQKLIRGLSAIFCHYQVSYHFRKAKTNPELSGRVDRPQRPIEAASSL